ncbi:hypothetical protein GGR44_000744 [Sphingobium fontiphilum]|uniref:Uncharacterized protein n=1 Tax=Sphingobium fontiphilum TaxID=944425 RepID=A0A7W6DDE1_9SPHN|nr:hypothetical protein [Sphingobium fontiphilum]MBB3981113.1 hypothetical protein [Sphingobium fontiphilum]
MREISHKLAFADVPAAIPFDIFAPNEGGGQAHFALGDAAPLDRAVDAVQTITPRWRGGGCHSAFVIPTMG